LKKVIRGHCPCGYDFGTFSDKKTAVVEVRLHIERVHKDFLPFGITDAEISALLDEGRVRRKQKVALTNFC